MTNPPPGPSAGLQALPLPPCGLGESPFWHPDQGALFWVTSLAAPCTATRRPTARIDIGCCRPSPAASHR